MSKKKNKKNRYNNNYNYYSAPKKNTSFSTSTAKGVNDLALNVFGSLQISAKEIS
jgi:hypothetical protein